MFLHEWFVVPLNFGFMQNALLASCVIGIVCAILSCFLVLKGWSLMGDAVSHAVLPGIAIAEVIGFSHPIGAFISGLMCAVFTGFIDENSRLKQDTVMGIVFSGMFALGILMIASIETDKHLMHVIMGNLLGITRAELNQTLMISGLVVVVMMLKWKDFLLYAFDASHARVVGLPTKILHYSLLIMLALTIVAAIQAVGVIMVVSLLIAPGITGFILTKRFSTMLIIAIVVSVIAATMGVVVSFHIDASTAACIVLAQSLLFALAFVIKKLILAINQEKTSDYLNPQI
ncbi:MAG: iron ABC transporter permease [Gammaproteobacteria bacterium]|nr:MAG: iron ABC transporter permease [Gammaproteobacteria bacterium]